MYLKERDKGKGLQHIPNGETNVHREIWKLIGNNHDVQRLLQSEALAKQ